MHKTETEHIRLCFDLYADPQSPREQTLTDSWGVLRKNAVEPGQAPTPLLSSFADECLLCALILKKGEEETEEEKSLLQLDPSSTASEQCSASGTTTDDDPVGLIYVRNGFCDPSTKEVNVGIIIRKDMRRKGYARDAMRLALAWVFGSLQFHRVQAAILDTPDKDGALLFFTSLGFTHEGTRRRAVYQPCEQGEWKDVTYLAMLDTDWLVRKSLGIRDKHPTTLWDEMLDRHAREREALLEWEEDNRMRLRRSTSMETIRNPTSNRAGKLTMTAAERERLSWESDYSTSSRQSSVVGSRPPSPGPDIFVSLAEDEDCMDSGVPDVNDSYSAVSPLHHQPPWVRESGDTQLWLDVSPSRLRILPSIPSSRGSRIDSEYPITIPSSPASPPPNTPSVAADNSDGESDSDSGGPPPPGSPVLDRADNSYPAGTRPKRRRSSQSSSASVSTMDSWSDAQSSLNSSSDWDMMDSGTEA